MQHSPMQAPAEEELLLLRNETRSFVRDNTDHKRLRKLRETLPGHVPDLARRYADLGWTGVLFPEALGGSATGFAALGVVLEELGRGLIADPLIAHCVLAGRALLLGENDTLAGELVPALAAGRRSAALAWQEQAGVLDPAAISTTVVIDGTQARLDGAKQFVAGPACSGFVVSARSTTGLALAWVPRDTPGLDLAIDWRADGTPMGRLLLAGVRVPAVNLSPIDAAALEQVLDEATAMVCAEMVGVMRAALDTTTEYMRNRVQFGRPIGSFQALQHKAVDLFIQQELAAAVAAEAAELLDREHGAEERVRTLARAKARCNDACLRITRECIQLHGGIGTTDECDIGLYFKRALTLSAWLGSSPVQRRRYAPFAKLECEQDV